MRLCDNCLGNERVYQTQVGMGKTSYADPPYLDLCEPCRVALVNKELKVFGLRNRTMENYDD